MVFVNLTPHAIHLVHENSETTIQPSGMVARCVETTTPLETIDGIDLVYCQYGDVEGLPDPLEGTIFIVSMLVRQRLTNRKDIASPGELIRDENGNIMGCRNLIVNWRKAE